MEVGLIPTTMRRSTGYILEMKKYNVERAILSGLSGEGYNEFVIRIAANDKRFFAVPMMEDIRTEEIVKWGEELNRMNIRAVKFHPRFCKCGLNSEAFNTLLKICRQFKFLLFVCTVPNYENGLEGSNFVRDLQSIVSKNQDINFVLLHGGYNQILQLSESLRQFENSIIDMSATIIRFKSSSISLDIKYLFETFDKRICLGTDFPEYDYEMLFKVLSEMGISYSTALQSGALGTNLSNFIKRNDA